MLPFKHAGHLCDFSDRDEISPLIREDLCELACLRLHLGPLAELHFLRDFLEAYGTYLNGVGSLD